MLMQPSPAPRSPIGPDVSPCACPDCEAFALELDAHEARVHDGTVTPADRERVERMAAGVDRRHRAIA
jgi:hypothetical protein